MSAILRSHIGEWFKVVELAAIQVLGFIENKRTFSTFVFSKSKLRNWLVDHLAALTFEYVLCIWL